MTLGRRITLGFVVLWFAAGGIGHFTPQGHAFFTGIVPPYLPNASLLVYVSGFFELLGAAGMLIPRVRPYAGYGLIALVIAVTPANYHMWQNPDLFPGVPVWFYGARLVFQVVLLWMIWWAACSKPRERLDTLAKVAA